MADMVGLIGTGDMGQGLLARLKLAGVPVKAFDVSAENLAKAREMGAEAASSAADAARDVHLIHLFVRTDDQALEATLGAGGVLEGAGEGSILILHPTIMPETTRKIAEAAAAKGVTAIDCPITAVPRRVHAGEATFLVGGPDEVVAEVRPHLEALGKQVCHFGPLTSGNIAKICKNLTNGIERVMLSEAARIAAAGGLDAEQFLNMARSISTGAAVMTWDRYFTVENGQVVPPHPEPDDILLSKDVQHAAALAQSFGLDLPLTKGAAATARAWLEGRTN
ncbi:MAG: NAD(P)-dependent oxidoreductase [Alphaproteobacteria bacterium]|nr:NAD(P)-dependent oxidoreductase [Alphaproteobacteria bacterium]